MTPKLQKLIKDTAADIVDKTEDCLFDASKIKLAEGLLETFANKIVTEVNPPSP